MPDDGIVPAFSAQTVAAGDRASGDPAPAGHSIGVKAPSPAPVGLLSEPRALICQPCRSAMVSDGKARSRPRVLEFARQSPNLSDPLMGWTGSEDAPGQIHLRFPSREAAIADVCRNGIALRP